MLRCRAPKIRRSRRLHPVARTADTYVGYAAFRAALTKLGHVEGQSINIEPRFAAGQLDRLPDFATELVGLTVMVYNMNLSQSTKTSIRLLLKRVPCVIQVGPWIEPSSGLEPVENNAEKRRALA